MSANRIAVAELIVLLKSKCCSHIELSEYTGLGGGTVGEWMQVFRKRKLIRIGEWKRHGKNWQWYPLWEWNDLGLPDEKKPAARTPAERRQAYRDKQKGIKEANLLNTNAGTQTT